MVVFNKKYHFHTYFFNYCSRLLFGAISYKRVCLVVDAAADIDHEDFNEFIDGLCSLKTGIQYHCL